MKVLHVLDHSLPIHSGYAFRTEGLLVAEQQIGYTVVACTGPKHEPRFESGHYAGPIDYRRCRFARVSLKSVPVANQFEVIRALTRGIVEIATREGADLIHAHSPSLNGIAAIRAGRRLSVPVVYEMRALWEDAAVDHGTSRADGLRYRLTRASESWVFRRANAITTICDGLKSNICERGISPDSVFVIPNAVDTDTFRPLTGRHADLREKHDAAERFAVVFCGSFYRYEGLDTLIDAVARLRERIPSMLVLLAGGGEWDQILRDRVLAEGLSDVVRFLGRVSQECVVELYNIADVCVFPRRRNKLTEIVTPLKPLEAMASGSVVLGSDVGGHRELIEDGVTGYLYQADVPDSLDEKLLMLATSSNGSSVGESARSFVLNERTWKASAEKYADVYRTARAAAGAG